MVFYIPIHSISHRWWWDEEIIEGQWRAKTQTACDWIKQIEGVRGFKLKSECIPARATLKLEIKLLNIEQRHRGRSWEIQRTVRDKERRNLNFDSLELEAQGYTINLFNFIFSNLWNRNRWVEERDLNAKN